jgi:sigma-B regulation protein RsbU (phosphoserine phosphatase)
MRDHSPLPRADASDDAAWNAVLADLLRRCQVVQPDELAAEINVGCRAIGLDASIYLIDHEQQKLWPVPERGKPLPPPLAVDGTVAGRAFTAVRSLPGRDRRDAVRWWVPMVDGAERLGVVEVLSRTVPADPERLRRNAETLVMLVAHLISIKSAYGDLLHQVRRTRAMHPSGELLLSMLPPLTFTCERMVLSAVLEPCYDVGGDAYDYAVDGSMARFMLFDAMGRGLQAALTSAAVLAAVRAARRDDLGLYAMARAADAALIEQFPRLRFVTAVLGELDIDSGLLRYLNAGHPPPTLMRRGKALRTLTGGRRLPLGLDDSEIQVGEEFLEPGDRLLLHTDGVTEAYDRDGDPFGTRRLTRLAERFAADQLPAPETLRLLSHAVIDHRDDRLTDDATLMLIEWSHDAVERTQP